MNDWTFTVLFLKVSMTNNPIARQIVMGWPCRISSKISKMLVLTFKTKSTWPWVLSNGAKQESTQGKVILTWVWKLCENIVNTKINIVNKIT